MVFLDSEKKAMLAAIFAYFVFGLSFAFSKVALEIVSPAELLFFRFFLAFLLLNLMLISGKVKKNLKGKKLLPLLLLGILQPVIYFYCENYGVQMTTATFSAVVIAVVPVVTLLGGVLFLKEIPSVWQILFMILSVVGVSAMALMKGDDGTVTLAGIILLLLAVVAEAAYVALTRKLSVEYSVFERTYVMFAVGLVAFLPVCLWENGGNVADLCSCLLHSEVLIAVLFLGAACSFGAFLCLNYANTHLPVARTAAFSNLTTVISVIAGVIFLKEDFTVFTLAASVMIIIGVWGVQHFKREEETH